MTSQSQGRARMLLEVACFNSQSVKEAILAGAQRIELCSERLSGGLTPDSPKDAAIQDAASTVPINLMIRCNQDPGFRTTDDELVQMESDIRAFKPYASGFVFGFLNDDRTIDIQSCSRLLKAASPSPCTFHRAFDHSEQSLSEKLDIVHSCGFARILTSGGIHDAVEGTEVLKETVIQAKALGIEVIVGGGVRSGSVGRLVEATGATSFHTAAITTDGDMVSAQEVTAIRDIMMEHD